LQGKRHGEYVSDALCDLLHGEYLMLSGCDLLPAAVSQLVLEEGEETLAGHVERTTGHFTSLLRVPKNRVTCVSAPSA
jgi:hypothetical protein